MRRIRALRISETGASGRYRPKHFGRAPGGHPDSDIFYITAAKPHSWGYQVSPLRSQCKTRPDSAWHRAFECDATAEERAEVVDETLLHEALAAGPEDNLFGKLWMPIPEINAQPGLDE
eukprot:8064754-Pyramimonas_sp.AAC.1